MPTITHHCFHEGTRKGTKRKDRQESVKNKAFEVLTGCSYIIIPLMIHVALNK